MAFDAGSVIGFLKLDIKNWLTEQQKALKANEKFNQNLVKNGKATQQFGKSILKLGVGITAFVATTVKFASDQVEATSKFKRAFIGVEEQAKKTTKVLQNGYGLSILESNRLLGSTGDLLKGFGATSKEALEFSFILQKSAVDLTSYNDVMGGSTRASRILTKAVFGNKEGLEELGAKVLDSDVKARLFDKGQEKLTGTALKLAKAYVVLELVMEQNKDAVGDFGRTQAEVANSSRVLKSEAINTAVAFGTHLLPMAKSLINTFRGILKGISTWIKENPALSGMIIKTTAIVGGLALVIGSMTVAVGIGMIAWGKFSLMLTATSVPAIFAVGTALKTALPVLLAFTAAAVLAKVASEAIVGASARALKKTIELGNAQGRRIKEVTEFMKQASPIEKQIIIDQMNLMRKMGFTNVQVYDAINAELNKNSKSFKTWKIKVEKSIKDARDKLAEGGKDVEIAFRDQNGIIKKAIETYKRMTLDQFAFRKFQAKQSFDESTALLKEEGAKEEQFLILKKAFNSELVQIEKDRFANLKTAREKDNADQQKKWEEQTEREAERIANDAESDLIEVERKTFMQDMIKALSLERSVLLANEVTGKKLMLDAEYKRELALLELKATDHKTFLEAKALLDENFRIKKDKVDEKQNEKDKWRVKNFLKFASNTFKQLQDIFNQMSANKIAKLESQYAIERQFIIDNVEDETEREKQLEALEMKLVTEKRKAAKLAFLANKASSMASAIINTANAVTSALKAPFPFNLIAAGIVGAMGAVQVGLIAGQKMPALAEGGVTTGSTIAQIGEKGTEVILPLDKFLNSVGVGEEGGSEKKVINIHIHALDTVSMVDAVRNKVVPILQEAFNDEILLVNPNSVRMA